MTLSLAPCPAPETTWLLVTMWPLASMITPEPCPCLLLPSTLIATTASLMAAAVAVQSGLFAEDCATWVVVAVEKPLELLFR